MNELLDLLEAMLKCSNQPTDEFLEIDLERVALELDLADSEIVLNKLWQLIEDLRPEEGRGR